MENINSILSNRGYIVNKNNLNSNTINKIKKDLLVEPFSINKNFNNDTKFKLYLENKTQLCLPKYYGINNIGKPDIDDIEEGEDININFDGKLRDYQIKILNIFIPKFLKQKGGSLLYHQVKVKQLWH